MTDDLSQIVATARQESAPVFRALRDGPVRQAVKLEDFWWDRIERLAAVQGLSTAALVFRLLADLPEGENKTAYLRRCAGAALAIEAERRQSAAALRALLSTCPAPALIVSANGLVDQNTAALRDLGRRLLQHAPLEPGDVEIRRVAALELLAALRSAGGVAEHEVRIRAHDSSRLAPVRATLFPCADEKAPVAQDWALCWLL